MLLRKSFVASCALALLAATRHADAACKSHFGEPSRGSSTTDDSIGHEASDSTGSGVYGSPSPTSGSAGSPSPSGSSAYGSPSPSTNSTPSPASPVPTSTASSPSPSPPSSSGSSSSGSVDIGDDDNSAWRFKPVTSIQVRVQGNLPVWDAEHAAFISSFGSSFEAKYLGVTDTVNMAAVEGAFKYVQAECINLDAVINCTRKNNVKYVAFYETTIVQPKPAMARYQKDTSGVAALEHCPYVAMDGGQCTPKNGVFPAACDQYTGANGQSKLGFCVGGTLQENDVLAPYPSNYWFSYPNSCPRAVWADKSTACRAEQAGGLCPFGVQPDGVTCTFSYKILGYISLDDVVGITSMVNPLTKKTFADYGEFCRAGGVEFNVLTAGLELLVKQTIPFWSEPLSRKRNTERVQKLVDSYNALVQQNATTKDGGVMAALPSVAQLTKKNPQCYENSVQCAQAKFGCRRTLYSQICSVCTAAAADCVVKPASYVFPQL